MFKEAIDLINNSNKIYIVAHVNPDGDAIGSTFAIYLALKKLGKEAKVIMPSFSDTFGFLPHIDEAVDRVKDTTYDLLIALDSSSKDRLAILDEDFIKAKNVLMIDHHKEEKAYGNINYIDSNMPATAEITYNFILELGVQIDKDIATYLYTGIMTDTGSFNYSNTKPSTFIAASKLIETGIDFSYICKKLNDTIKESKLKLIAKTVDNMEVLFDGKLRYSYVDYETMNSLGINDEDAEGMTNYLRMVEGTEISAYVRQRSDGSIKVSLRSGSVIDVSKIAIHFGGGGHVRAAGYTMGDNYDIEKQKFIEQVEVILNGNTSN